MGKTNYKKKYTELLKDLLKLKRYYSDHYGDLFQDDGGDLIQVDDLEHVIKKYDPKLISEPKPVEAKGYIRTASMTYIQKVPEGYMCRHFTDTPPPTKS